ncbi:MAG TPA: hypothetical protein VIH30_00810, partial [Aquirhabdus sp.]
NKNDSYFQPSINYTYLLSILPITLILFARLGQQQINSSNLQLTAAHKISRMDYDVFHEKTLDEKFEYQQSRNEKTQSLSHSAPMRIDAECCICSRWR